MINSQPSPRFRRGDRTKSLMRNPKKVRSSSSRQESKRPAKYNRFEVMRRTQMSNHRVGDSRILRTHAELRGKPCFRGKDPPVARYRKRRWPLFVKARRSWRHRLPIPRRALHARGNLSLRNAAGHRLFPVDEIRDSENSLRFHRPTAPSRSV